MRIGTLMPTPRVSVPQMTFSSPSWASFSTSRRYLRQHAGVVHADAVAQQPGQGLAEAGGEAEIADGLGDRVLLGPGADVHARQRLRLLERGGLGEVHDVDRAPGRSASSSLERLVQRGDA